MSCMVNSRNSDGHVWLLMWYANCCDRQLRYRSKSSLSSGVSNSTSVCTVLFGATTVCFLSSMCGPNYAHLQQPQDWRMCKWVFFFPPFFSLDYPFKVLHNLHRNNLFHILIISCVRRKSMGLFCCTLNISANISPLYRLSRLNLTCSGWDFSKGSTFLSTRSVSAW